MNQNIIQIFKGKYYAQYCLFFITTIYDELQKAQIFKKGETLTLRISAWSYPYSYDGLNFICQALKSIGYETKTPSYEVFFEGEKQKYIYTWKIKKI